MRRAEKEMTRQTVIEAVLRRGAVLHLGLLREGEPYVVPVSYGFNGEAIFIHSAGEGTKIDLIRAHPQVCFEITAQWALEPADTACEWGMSYESVIGWGIASFLEEEECKHHALTTIMNQYAHGQEHTFSKAGIAITTIIRIDIDRMTGKHG